MKNTRHRAESSRLSNVEFFPPLARPTYKTKPTKHNLVRAALENFPHFDEVEIIQGTKREKGNGGKSKDGRRRKKRRVRKRR